MPVLRFRATLRTATRVVASFEFDAASLAAALAYVAEQVPGWTSAVRVEIEVVTP